jgi:hypothetical protein
LLSEKFEFFHDKDSISHKKEFLYNLRNGLCKSPTTYQSRRELVSESTEIYPLYKSKVLYGAIQTGNHKFFETIAGNKETFASSARFTHVWLLENGIWKLTKSLSYNHQDNDIANYQSSIFDNETEIEKWLIENKVPTLGIGVIKDGKLQQVKVFGEIKKLPYVVSYDTNSYKIQNNVLKAYVNRILEGFKINKDVHSIIVNFDFYPLEYEMNWNKMWIEFKNESNKLIGCLYKCRYKKSDYILQLNMLDSNCHHNRVKIRKPEIKAIFNDLQDRTNMKIIDYIEDIGKKEFDLFD